VNNNVMVTSQMLCLEDGQRARDIAQNITIGYQNSLVFRYLDTFPRPPGIPIWPELIPEPTAESLEEGIKKGILTIGTPEECARAVPIWPELIPEPTAESLEEGIKKGILTIGTPEECARAVEGYGAVGADQMVFGMLSTTMPIEIAVEAVATFGKHVIPQFDKDPEHSTTRQRREQCGEGAAVNA
jgi:alkanesulfonate monooxygenase SsuD/methylene tetrahydromethanopterin reductase-like flavin-dependent oxidoreductase (luciferase family)